MNEEAIFAAALERATHEERQAFVEQACANNANLQALVEGLLKAHDNPDSFLEAPAPGLVPTIDEPPVTERPGTVIGPYKLLEQIGEGGFGVVFMAEQQEPIRRKVAVKVLKPGMDTRQVIARFEAERQALALMDHPNIAKVFDGGSTGGKPGGVSAGRPYFVMELVKGVPITEYCDQDQVPICERLELLLDVCQAVQHAHQMGIIHRDIKPSNVLIMSQDGTPLVKVIDFGVAKAVGQQLTDKTIYTQFTQLVGTPLYMSPEQAGQSGVDVDTRSDIYSLGVLLYELLTGTTPFDKARFKEAGYDEIRRIIREEEPPKPSTRISTLGQAATTASTQRKSAPRRLSQLFSGELDWIVMKCLEKDRNRRYESASALAADVQRYLQDEPVQACPPSVPYRLRKFGRRHKMALAMASVAAAALVLVAGAFVASAVSVWKVNQDLQQALDREEQTGYFQRIALAASELASNHAARAEQLLDMCRPQQRGWEWHFLERRMQEEPLTLVGHTQSIGGVDFSPTGRMLASASWDGSVRLWDPTTGKFLRAFAGDSPGFVRVAFSPDGQRLAAANWNGTVTVWELAANQERLLKGHTGRAVAVAFSPDSSHLASAGEDATVILWDLLKNEKRIFTGHGGGIYGLAYSPDGTRLASASEDQTVLVWDVLTGQPVLTLRGHKNGVKNVAFSPDGGLIATASKDRTVRLWDAKSGSEFRILRGHTSSVNALAFTPDGRRLASAGEDMTVRLWDPATGQEALILRDHPGDVYCIAISPDGNRLACGGTDVSNVGRVWVWNAAPVEDAGQEPLRTFLGHTQDVTCLAFSRDGMLLASGSMDKTLRVQNATTGEVIQNFDDCSAALWGVAFSPSGTHVAADGDNGFVKVWEVQTGRNMMSNLASPYNLNGVAYSPGGQHLALADYGGFVRVLDASTWKESALLDGRGGAPNAVTYSPDGRCLVAACDDKNVRVWDSTKKEVAVLQGHQASVTSVSYSSDCRYLASAAADGWLIVWNAATFQETVRFRAHRDQVNRVAFAPDGRRLASASRDGTVRVWDVSTGQLLSLLRARQGEVFDVAFHPTGKHLASAGEDATVKFWEAPLPPDPVTKNPDQ